MRKSCFTTEQIIGFIKQAETGMATASVLANDTGTVLSIVFDRLYVLRNQLVHGGATWNSRLNRAQVKDGAAILGKLTLAIVDLMLEYPDADFGEIFYPPV